MLEAAPVAFVLFFLTDTPTPEIYTLSLHDALPICLVMSIATVQTSHTLFNNLVQVPAALPDRKSTRLNSSHANISYAVFCLKKKKQRTPALQRVRPGPRRDARGASRGVIQGLRRRQ